MRREEFEEIVEQRIDRLYDVLFSKSDEYNDPGDVFGNFKRAGEINHQTPRKALWDMSAKHLVSIIDIVESGEPYDPEYVDEKIGDMINYLILLEGLLHEHWHKNKGGNDE